MTWYSVLAVTPTSEDWIPEYIGTATSLVERHGGRYFARTISHEQIEGDASEAAMRVIIEWPSKEAALAFMNDPAYASSLEARTAGSSSDHFLIEGKDDTA